MKFNRDLKRDEYYQNMTNIISSGNSNERKNNTKVIILYIRIWSNAEQNGRDSISSRKKSDYRCKYTI